MLELDEARASLCLDTCLALAPGERVVLLHDPVHADAARQLARSAERRQATSELVEVPERHRGQKGVPHAAADRLSDADVVVVIFDPEDACQFWHTTARMRASEAGARVGMIFPPATWDMTGADLLTTKALTDRVAQLLDDAREARITTRAGTDVSMGLAGRTGFSCHSILHEPGETATIPDWGDAEISPVEGTANGTIVYDASMAFVGRLDEPITVQVRDGVAAEITGGPQADLLDRILQSEGPESRNIAELGIGTVPRGEVTGHKDDNLFGTLHLALGHNVSLGGTVEAPVHLDGVLHAPNLWLDGRLILEEGRLVPWLAEELGRPELAAWTLARS